MDLQAVRALALDVAMSTHGVDAAVTVPDGTAVPSRLIWLSVTDEIMPVGREFQRRDPRRIAAIPLSESLPDVPRGSLVVAALPGATVARRWFVEGIDRAEADQQRVILKPAVGSEE